MLDGYYYCLNCHSEITPDYNEHCTFCGCYAVAVSGDYSNEEVERAFDLLNKEQQGLVIVPPCKVGDTVYVIFGEEENICIDEFKVKYFYCSSKGIDRIYIECGNFRPKDIGKTVFLTKEEAEAALKVRCGK